MRPGSATPPTDRPTVSVRVSAAAARRVRRGHPWVFASDISRVGREGAPGDTAVVYDHRNRAVGVGLYDPGSPIRVRMLGPPGTRPGAELEAERLDAALALRADLAADPETSGFRLLHGPNDGVPGIVLDVYGRTGVLKLYSEAWLPRLPELLALVAERAALERVVFRASRNVQGAFTAAGWSDGAIVHGPPLEGPVPFLEHGITFAADPVAGHKTGFFLDQRDNRARVGSRSAGKRVLNVFSYNGGFSLHALRGGATEVVSVDISRPAITSIDHNLALNANAPWAAPGRHRGIVGDAYDVLADLKREAPFDVVVVDPPSFAKRAAERDRALDAYTRLARAAVAVCAPGGTVVMASCSSRVSADQFERAISEGASAAGRPLRVEERTGHALDHPVRFEEAEYLKCLFARC